MYTIGQIANILGISRDKLRYYEEKGILIPVQNKDNNYRQYDLKDIDTILAIQFYRSLDLEFKNIKKLHKKSNIKDIEYVLDEKYNQVIEEIKRLNTIVNRIEKAKKGCNDINKWLNKFIIKPMAPIEILGEISNSRAYNEFDVIHKNRNNDVAIIKSLKRYIKFNDEQIESSKMLVTKDIESGNIEKSNDILEYEKCLYTIVEDDAATKGIMQKTYEQSLEWIYNNNYKHEGIAILSMLLIEFHEGRAKSYLEVYIPIK